MVGGEAMNYLITIRATVTKTLAVEACNALEATQLAEQQFDTKCDNTETYTEEVVGIEYDKTKEAPACTTGACSATQQTQTHDEEVLPPSDKVCKEELFALTTEQAV